MANLLNEGLTLQTLLNKVDALNQGELTLEELNEWGQTINIRSNLPIMDKMTLLMRLVNSTGYGPAESQEINVCELYKDMFFTLYLEGYLGVAVDSKDKTYANYDKLEPIFAPWIESFAEHDINLFKQMLHDTLRFYNAVNLNTALESVDTAKIDEATNANKDLISKLEENKQLVADLNSLMLTSNPKLNKLIDSIYEAKVIEAKDETTN